jgi:anti-sigma factor RsiW
MTRSDFTTSDIHLALDGELSADERADFERWLDAHAEMRALSARFARDRATLAAALAPVLDEPVPPKLVKTAQGETKPRRSWQALFRSAAAAVLLLTVGGAAGYLVAVGDWMRAEQAGDHFAENAISAYVTYAADQPHAVEVDGVDKLYLQGWLSKRIGVRLVAPDLAADGFTLLGGRILPAGQNVAALLVYKDNAGDQLSIYVTGPGETKAKGTYTADEGGPTAIYWLDQRYGCAIVSSMPQDRLAAVARNAWRQMVESAAS